MNLPKLLFLIAACAGTVGVFFLSGCDSCSQTPTDASAPAVTCGPGTVARGNQCVGTVTQ